MYFCTKHVSTMRRFILTNLFLAIFCCNAYSAYEGNIYTFFVTTTEGGHETVFLNYDRNIEVDGKNYQKYVGSYIDRTYADSLVLLRKEDKKYFYYDSQTSEEHLLFDFSLQKGDTFTDDFSGTVYNVVDVRDSLVNDSLRCLIEIRDPEGAGKHDIWMEDVGSIYTGILPKDRFKDVLLLICYHFCYSIKEDVVYSTYFFPNTPQLKTAGMSVTEPQWENELDPEEDWDAFLAWLHAPTDLNAEFENDTLHVWGRIRTSCSIQSYAACELSGDRVTFKAYPYSNLVEEDCISTYEVETRIPGFERGTYKVSLYNKTIELECAGAKVRSEESVTFTIGQMATIILPAEPDASKGKYYRLDRVEDGQIVFEQEPEPRAHVPYIIVPSEDFSIDPETLELAGLSADTTSIKGISFIGTYMSEVLPSPGGDGGDSYYDIIDQTPDCSLSPSGETGMRAVVGALRAYLEVNPKVAGWDDTYTPGGTRAPGSDDRKMTIVLKDDPSGLQMVNGKLSNDKCYDLQGRLQPFPLGENGKGGCFPLKGAGGPGIYIQNGRKVMKQ